MSLFRLMGKQAMLVGTSPVPLADVKLKSVTSDSIPVYIFNTTHEANLGSHYPQGEPNV
ncbi:hypothetical protein WBG78_27050 [Chryseolinea sp. T2]|uniref:hypothetical protein n=1 Tax=Chryseolinea sp. T2 TaxID=3129255 RepID=UPI0030784024